MPVTMFCTNAGIAGINTFEHTFHCVSAADFAVSDFRSNFSGGQCPQWRTHDVCFPGSLASGIRVVKMRLCWKSYIFESTPKRHSFGFMNTFCCHLTVCNGTIPAAMLGGLIDVIEHMG